MKTEPLLENPLDNGVIAISDTEFKRFRDLIYELAGISMSDAKRMLVSGRLTRRLRHYGLKSFSEYLKLLSPGNPTGESQTMVDLLTTNETYFFREQAHFDYLENTLLPRFPKGHDLEIWSAACSTGEEVYTLCMLLADKLGLGAKWRITGSDINTQVLATAKSGQYPMSKTRGLPEYYLKKYCLKGVLASEGSFMIAPDLLSRTRFRQVNLNTALPEIGQFDIIFLRNVMIYFDVDTKRRLIERLSHKLRPGGHLIIGHSESLHGFAGNLRLIKPTIYQRQD